MLFQLTVKNFAIIDNISIDFDNGLTCLTGETGAGKSLIIDAIGLLFGDRANSDLVRNGENKAFIEGVFNSYDKEVDNLLETNGIELLDNLIIKREVYKNGKSISKINGEIVTNNLLQTVSNYLGDIHTQFDTYKLVNPKNYLSFIDDNNIKQLLNIYKDKLNTYNKCNKLYLDKVKSKEELYAKLDFYKFKLEELTKAKLKINEDEELSKKFEILNNLEKIKENYYNAISIIDNNNILDSLYNLKSSLDKLKEYDDTLESTIKTIDNFYYELEDIYYNVKGKVKSYDNSDDDIDEINNRLSLLNTLKKKYKMSIKELIEYKDNLSKEVLEFDDYDFYIKQLETDKNKALDELTEIANKITDARIISSNILKDNLLSELSYLDLQSTTIEFDFTKTDSFTTNGNDEVDILVSFNKGEALKSLSKVASGGELSRFMLALKSIYTKNTNNKLFIFDEIDTGVSGEIASKIGNMLKSISKTNQVICITHLALVACVCDHHLFITKNEENGRVFSDIKLLSYEEKVNAIASMLSKGIITENAINLAKELIN